MWEKTFQLKKWVYSSVFDTFHLLSQTNNHQLCDHRRCQMAEESNLCFFAWTVLTRKTDKNPFFCTNTWPKNQNVCVFKKERQHQCWWLIDPSGENILTSVWLGSDLVQPINNEISGFELSTPTKEKQHLLLRCCSGGGWVQLNPWTEIADQYERCFFRATLDGFEF